MCARPSFLFALALVCQDVWLPGQANDLAAPLVAVVADGARAETLDAMLRAAGMRRRRIAVADCTPAALRLADVVVVDWPEGELPGALPLGELERWDRPTVFVGTSGERFAQGWGLPGPGEMARMAPPDLGPEMQRFAPPDGAVTEPWRQGHLWHFTCAEAPADLTAAERGWLLSTVRVAATFVTDRPVVRHATIAGAPLPEAERQRRTRIDTATELLRFDARALDELLALPDLLDGPYREPVQTVLQDLVADGPSVGTSRSNWGNWIKPRRDKLVWDALSQVWRLDELAFARGVASKDLRGSARADGGERDANALALATKVVQRYGGRAFDDLATFSCWQGEIHLSWDRRAGYFRAENHFEMPARARGVQWEVAVFDTAADRDVVRGGGPAPRPTVSASYLYRQLHARLFLPAMLLDPGTSIRRQPEADSAEQQALVVRLAQRGLDAKAEYLVMVVASSGEIVSVQDYSGGRQLQLWHLDATAACGPMQLPCTWHAMSRRNRSDLVVEQVAWNPVLPAAIESTTERLTAPRER